MSVSELTRNVSHVHVGLLNELMRTMAKRISIKARDYLGLFIALTFVKAIASIFISFYGDNIFGGGSDADYYHEYAIGATENAVNAWPIILRALNEISIYSRAGVSHGIKFIGFIIIPLLIAQLSTVKEYQFKSRLFWLAALTAGLYPTIIFFTGDIYRDVFMIFCWLLGLFVFQFLSKSPPVLERIFAYSLGLIFSIVLFSLRPYLGIAYLAALLLSGTFSMRHNHIALSLAALIALLFVFYMTGALQPLLEYRAGFLEGDVGGSTLGITFSSPMQFVPDLIKSTGFQLFGLYFNSGPSVFAFVSESIPFSLLLGYVIKNRRHTNRFIDYLVVFFVVYSAFWLLGNDNLGTAVRLRTFNYLVVIIAFFLTYQNKVLAIRNASLRS